MSAKCAAQELPDTAIIRVFPGAVKTRLVDEVLQANTEASTVFRAIRERGELAEPQHVAEFIVSILVDAPDDLVRKNDAWDYNCETDREQIAGLRKPVPPDATEK
jgi:NAD(P)-dependent dehydrogenase (short-subunit alcohol dehydrogenase family)